MGKKLVICEKPSVAREIAQAVGAAKQGEAWESDESVASLCEHVLWIPPVADELLVPIVAVVHLQILARYVARTRGCDVDKPRNLAKSVTVE